MARLTRIHDARPARGFEVAINLTKCSRFPMILRLIDTERNLPIAPLDDGSQPHSVLKDNVGSHPSFQVFQRCSGEKFDGVPKSRDRRIIAEIDDRMADQTRHETKRGRNRHLGHPVPRFIGFHDVLGPVMQVGIVLSEVSPRGGGLDQKSKFASCNKRLFGLVLREAGPVSPRTREVVWTKVA